MTDDAQQAAAIDALIERLAELANRKPHVPFADWERDVREAIRKYGIWCAAKAIVDTHGFIGQGATRGMGSCSAPVDAEAALQAAEQEMG